MCPPSASSLNAFLVGFHGDFTHRHRGSTDQRVVRDGQMEGSWTRRPSSRPACADSAHPSLAGWVGTLLKGGLPRPAPRRGNQFLWPALRKRNVSFCGNPWGEKGARKRGRSQYAGCDPVTQSLRGNIRILSDSSEKRKTISSTIILPEFCINVT